MSFGWSIGDVLSLTRLAWNVLQNARKACGEHDELTQEVLSLHVVLKRLQHEVAKPESPVNRPGDTCKEEIECIAGGCHRVLRILDQILERYSALNEAERSGRKLWQKITFGNGQLVDIANHRSKIVYYTSAMSLLVNMVSIGTIGCIEKQMNDAGGDLREIKQTVNGITAHLMARGHAEGSILTAYPDDDKAIWKQLRRELIKEGFSSSVIHEHKDLIKAYVAELASRGLFDDEDFSEPDPQGDSIESRFGDRVHESRDAPATVETLLRPSPNQEDYGVDDKAVNAELCNLAGEDCRDSKVGTNDTQEYTKENDPVQQSTVTETSLVSLRATPGNGDAMSQPETSRENSKRLFSLSDRGVETDCTNRSCADECPVENPIEERLGNHPVSGQRPTGKGSDASSATSDDERGGNSPHGVNADLEDVVKRKTPAKLDKEAAREPRRHDRRNSAKSNHAAQKVFDSTAGDTKKKNATGKGGIALEIPPAKQKWTPHIIPRKTVKRRTEKKAFQDTQQIKDIERGSFKRPKKILDEARKCEPASRDTLKAKPRVKSPAVDLGNVRKVLEGLPKYEPGSRDTLKAKPRVKSPAIDLSDLRKRLEELPKYQCASQDSLRSKQRPRRNAKVLPQRERNKTIEKPKKPPKPFSQRNDITGGDEKKNPGPSKWQRNERTKQVEQKGRYPVKSPSSKPDEKTPSSQPKRKKATSRRTELTEWFLSAQYDVIAKPR